jgi:glycosyltransferase involved in cell wall biosynthesis
MSQESTSPRSLVSVVVPTYNYGRFIGETLDSLRAQTYEEWECVVVDDGSTDDTEEVVARVSASDARVRYLRQANQRQAVAKNTGLADARGRYVQFLDADDLLEPRKLERQVAFLEANPAADIVYGGVRYFHTERPDERLYGMHGEAGPWLPELSGAGRELVAALVRMNILAINSALVRREVFEDVGPFDPVLPPVEDWDYWLRCALKGKRFEFRGFEGTLALVRIHAASTSRQPASVLAAWRALRA